MTHIRCLAIALARLAGALLAFAAAAPAAFAWGQPPLPAGWNKHPPLMPVHVHQSVHQLVPVPVHTVVADGMPGWQIVLIAAGAALAAAAIAILVNRAWAARKAHATTA
jgi:hypothetical protein